MPIIKSSKKRALQSIKRANRNSRLKKNIRLAMQTFEAKLNTGPKTDVANAQVKLQSLLDTASKKNVFHKNKVSRRKARIARMAKEAKPVKKPQVAAKKTTSKTK